MHVLQSHCKVDALSLYCTPATAPLLLANLLKTSNPGEGTYYSNFDPATQWRIEPCWKEPEFDLKRNVYFFFAKDKKTLARGLTLGPQSPSIASGQRSIVCSGKYNSSLIKNGLSALMGSIGSAFSKSAKTLKYRKHLYNHQLLKKRGYFAMVTTAAALLKATNGNIKVAGTTTGFLPSIDGITPAMIGRIVNDQKEVKIDNAQVYQQLRQLRSRVAIENLNNIQQSVTDYKDLLMDDDNSQIDENI